MHPRFVSGHEGNVQIFYLRKRRANFNNLFLPVVFLESATALTPPPFSTFGPTRGPAAFIRVVGSEFVQKYLGEGPRMVRGQATHLPGPGAMSYMMRLLVGYCPPHVHVSVYFGDLMSWVSYMGFHASSVGIHFGKVYHQFIPPSVCLLRHNSRIILPRRTFKPSPVSSF